MRRVVCAHCGEYSERLRLPLLMLTVCASSAEEIGEVELGYDVYMDLYGVGDCL